MKESYGGEVWARDRPRRLLEPGPGVFDSCATLAVPPVDGPPRGGGANGLSSAPGGLPIRTSTTSRVGHESTCGDLRRPAATRDDPGGPRKSGWEAAPGILEGPALPELPGGEGLSPSMAYVAAASRRRSPTGSTAVHRVVSSPTAMRSRPLWRPTSSSHCPASPGRPPWTTQKRASRSHLRPLAEPSATQSRGGQTPRPSQPRPATSAVSPPGIPGGRHLLGWRLGESSARHRTLPRMSPATSSGPRRTGCGCEPTFPVTAAKPCRHCGTALSRTARRPGPSGP